MVHKKVLGKELSSKVERLSLAQLRVLLILILSILSERGHLTKKQRKSLAITEGQLGIRKRVLKEEQEIVQEKHHPRMSKKKRSKKHKKSGKGKRVSFVTKSGKRVSFISHG